MKTYELKFILLISSFFIAGCHSKKHTIDYIDSNGNKVSLYSVEKGKGQPIVFIHGNSFDHSIWDKQFQSKGLNTYRIISYDLRGHGRSTHFNDPAKASKQYSVHLHAEDLEQIIKYYKLNNVLVVGWSLGGNIVLHSLGNQMSPKIAKALIFGATPSFGLIPDKNYPKSKPSKEMNDMLKDFLMNSAPSDNAIEKFVVSSLTIDGSPSGLKDSEMVRWKNVVKGTDGNARLGIFDGIAEVSNDLSDGKLDMSSAIFSSYNISQCELIEKIAQIHIPVKILISDNDFFSMDQVSYMKKINSKMFSTSNVYHAGHSVFYNSPVVFEKELLSFIAQ